MFRRLRGGGSHRAAILLLTNLASVSAGLEVIQ